MIPAEFIRMAEHVANLPSGTIVGPSRLKPHVKVRTAVVHVMRAQLRADPDTGKVEARYSLPVLGRMLGRDHSTIIAALERAERLLAEDPDFVALVNRLHGLADEQDLANQLIAAKVSAKVAAVASTVTPRTRMLAVDLKRKVKRRNDMLADDQDGIERAKGSIRLAQAIAAARAAA